MKAFPTVNWVQQHGQPPNDEGMDLRDYFAAKFIPLICAYSELNGWNHLENAKICYKMADAMMEARKQ